MRATFLLLVLLSLGCSPVSGSKSSPRHFVNIAWASSIQPPVVSTYQVLRSIDGVSYIVYASTVFTKFTDNNVQRRHTYWYKVDAVGTTGLVSPTSNVVKVRIP